MFWFSMASSWYDSVVDWSLLLILIDTFSLLEVEIVSKLVQLTDGVCLDLLEVIYWLHHKQWRVWTHLDIPLGQLMVVFLNAQFWMYFSWLTFRWKDFHLQNVFETHVMEYFKTIRQKTGYLSLIIYAYAL